jgi:hypothetical protein
MWDETVLISEVIWVGGEQKYFCKRDWTDFPNQHGEVACGEDQGRLDGRFRVDWTLFSGTERGASMSSRGR